MPQPTKRKYKSLQAGRAIAAIMVVVFHMTSFVGGDPRYWRIQWLSTRFFGLSLGVAYFFVLSGAVITLAHLRDIGQPGAFWRYAWRRFSRVYPIYWVILTVLVAEYSLRPHLGAAYQTEPWVILSGYLLLYVNTLQVNLPVAWTLFHEVLFYTVFSVLILNKKIGAVTLGTWCSLSCVMLVLPASLYLSTYLFSPLHLLFAGGMAAGWVLYEKGWPYPRAALVAGLPTFLAAVVWAGVIGETSYPIELVAGAGAALLLLATSQLEAEGRLSIPRALTFLGDASYSIYLVHYPAYMFLTPFLFKAWLRLHPPVVVVAVLMVAAAVAAGCAVHVWVERPMMEWFVSRTRRVPSALAVAAGGGAQAQ